MTNRTNIGQVARKIYTSSRGLTINIDEFLSDKGDVRAVGNIRMNARGDVLDGNNQILVRRDQIAQNYHAKPEQVVTNASFKPLLPDTFDTPAEALEKLEKAAEAASSTKLAVDPLTDSAPSMTRRRKIIESPDD